jgi:hypothetical protein
VQHRIGREVVDRIRLYVRPEPPVGVASVRPVAVSLLLEERADRIRIDCLEPARLARQRELPSWGRDRPPEALAARCRAFAVLDAVFEIRYPTYSFSAAWPPGVALAEMSNGSGDLYAIVFEAAFLFEEFFDATVCAWREVSDTAWRCGPVEFDEGSVDPDGASHLFGTLVGGTVAAYAEYASDYFGRDVDTDAVAAVLDGRPLTPAIVGALNADAVFADVARVAVAAGYPIEGEVQA